MKLCNHVESIIYKILLTVSDVSDTLSTLSTAFSIYGKFDATLVEDNLKLLL